jgi:hypothetical protein
MPAAPAAPAGAPSWHRAAAVRAARRILPDNALSGFSSIAISTDGADPDRVAQATVLPQARPAGLPRAGAGGTRAQSSGKFSGNTTWIRGWMIL